MATIVSSLFHVNMRKGRDKLQVTTKNMKINIHGKFSTRGSYIKFSKNRSNVDDTTSIWRMTKVRKQCLRYCFGTKIISNETFFCGFILNNKSLSKGRIALCKTKNKSIKNVIECSKTLKVSAMISQCICINIHLNPKTIYLVLVERRLYV